METKRIWNDITAACKESIGLMTDINPMIASSDFSLYDSMSAVELMDPKMDQCCGIVGPVNTTSLLQYDSNNEDISTTTLVSLLQSLVVYEVSFLDGASLMETVSQCRFMWKETWSTLETSNKRGENIILAFCKSLSKSLGCTFTALLAADIFEEEDFQGAHRSYLGEDMDDVQLDDLMTRTMHRLESDETLSGSAGSTEMYLLLQLRCRHSLHALQSALGSWIHTTVAKYSRLMRIKQRRQEGKAPASTETEEGEDTDLAAVVQECGHIRTLATSALSAIKRLQVYHNESVEADSGESLGGGVGDITSHTESAALAFAFNPALAKMVLVSPLRHVRLRKFSESLTYLAKMCEEVIGVTVTACQLLDAHLTLTYDELLGVSLGLSESRPHVLARSLYLAVMYSLSPTLHLMLQRSMLWHALPNSIVRCELVTQQWLPENPSSAAWETIKLLCSNRNTIPARMDQALSLWGAVSNDAVFVDEKFRIDNEIPDVQQWCSSWALVQTAGVMDLHMALLVESDVLGVQELDYFFWYWDYICTTKSFALGKLRDQRFSLDEAVFSSATERWRASEAEKAVTGKTNKKKNNSKGSKDKSPAVSSSPAPNLPTPSKRPLTVDEMMVSGRAQLCRALFRMAIVCGQVGLVDKAENRFMSWDCRFELRFKAFRNINNPPMLSHADFYRTVHSRGSEQSQSAAEVPIDVHPVLTGAGVCFQNARKYLDEVRRMPVTHQADLLAQNKALVLTKVAVANSLSLMKASKLIPRPQAEQRLSPLQHRLGVNLSYDKHHPVLEVAVVV